MKKFLVFLAAVCLFSSCGTGVYTVSSGKADKSELSFVSKDKMALDVTVDGAAYSVNSVKEKAWKKTGNIKKTALNTISITTGQHEVSVSGKNGVIYSKKIFVSTGEHKIIEL